MIGGAGTGIEGWTTDAGVIIRAGTLIDAGAWGTAVGFDAAGTAAMGVAAVRLVVVVETPPIFWSKAARAAAWAGLSPAPADVSGTETLSLAGVAAGWAGGGVAGAETTGACGGAADGVASALVSGAAAGWSDCINVARAAACAALSSA